MNEFSMNRREMSEPAVERSDTFEILHKGPLIIEKNIIVDNETSRSIEVIIRNGAKSVSLNQKLPVGWRIVEYDYITSGGADPRTQEISIPQYMQDSLLVSGSSGQEPFLEAHGGFAILFHEIGHAYFDASIPEEERVSRWEEKETIIYSEKDPSSMWLEELDRYIDYVVLEEEYAWGKALELLEALKADGLECESDTEKIVSLKERSLATYKDETVASRMSERGMS